MLVMSISPDWRLEPVLKLVPLNDINLSDPTEDLSRVPETPELGQWVDIEEREKNELAVYIPKIQPKGIDKYPEFPHLIIVEETANDSEKPTRKFIPSVFKIEEECSSEEKKFIFELKQVTKKIYDTIYTIKDLVRAQRSHLNIYRLRQKEEGLPLNKEISDTDTKHVINQFWIKFL